MNHLQLYINDQLVDLNDDSPVALTFQINNLAEVQNQQGNTSNQFKLPLTQRNRQILGFPDDIAFTTNAPYQQYQAKLVQDGLEIIPYGVAELNNVEQNNANITVLSGNVDFFDAIDGKLYDMGDSTSQWTNYGQNLVWQPYDHTWNRIQVFGIGLAGLGGTLATIHGIPANLTTALISAGTAIAAIAQFAVKLEEPVNTSADKPK